MLAWMTSRKHDLLVFTIVCVLIALFVLVLPICC